MKELPSSKRQRLIRQRARAQGLEPHVDSETWSLAQPCVHEFQDGVCAWCFCPETDADCAKSEAAIERERETDLVAIRQNLLEKDPTLESWQLP